MLPWVGRLRLIRYSLPALADTLSPYVLLLVPAIPLICPHSIFHIVFTGHWRASFAPTAQITSSTPNNTRVDTRILHINLSVAIKS